MAVAVVISNLSEASPMIGWAWQCARARGEDIAVLVPTGKEAAEDAEPIPTIRAAVSDASDAHARMAAAHVESEDHPDQEPERSPQVQIVPVKTNGEDVGDTLLKAISEQGAKLLIVAKHAKAKGNEEALPVKLFREAACMVLLIRLGSQSTGVRCQRVLVPTAGGPHATEAIKLASKITQLPDPTCAIEEAGPAGVDALYIEPDIGPESEMVGRRILDKAIKRAVGDKPSEHRVRPIVEIDKEFRNGLTRVVERGGYDLLLVGAANQWHARKALFSMLPNEVLNDEGSLTIGVVRQPKPLMTATAERIRQLFSRGIPQLAREDRVSLVERVQSASQWNIDFIALICLSTAIATLGLMQNSTAVVIGAMLVAPLMTPLIGCGLAVVQGNGFLMRHASKSVLLGFLVALVLAMLMGLIIPHAGITGEMLSRGKPNALDLAVALISGIAAAYATARPNLLGALPGVAIAAALVPPIATSGVALSHGDFITSAGAAMLFFTNIIAIVLGAAAALFAVGMQAQHLHAREKRWTRHAIMGLTVGAVVLSVPLIYFLYDSLPKDEISASLQTEVENTVEANDGITFDQIELDTSQDLPVYTVTLLADQAGYDNDLSRDLDKLIETNTGKPCRVRVIMHRLNVSE
ncbi:MAG: TIGR00341 family protein [Phycisphaeraceae bacterium]